MDPNTSNNNNQDTSTNTTTTNTNNNNNTQWQYPQYQVPPQQYQQVQVPNTPYHNSPKGVWVTKLIFRIFAIIFSIIVIGLAGALAGFSEDDFSWSYDGYIYYSDYWTAGPLVVWIPTAAVSLIWSIAESICIVARKSRRGIHPGAIIAIDLLLWLGFVGSVIAYTFILFYNSVDYSYASQSDVSDSVQGLGAASIAFGSLLIITHIVLFSFGCYEVSVRSRSPAPVIIFNNGGPMPQHPHQSMYGQPQQQPPMAGGYGQPILLPVGQAPPAGYVPYHQYNQYPKPGDQPQQQQHLYPHSGQSSQAVSPPPQEPSPVHTNPSARPANDWQNSYQTARQDHE